MNTDTKNFKGHMAGLFVEEWDYSHATPPRKELNVQTKDHLVATFQRAENGNPYNLNPDIAMANAKLYASAPDLLRERDELRAALAHVVAEAQRLGGVA